MQILQLLLSGIAQGCIYGLIALGFVLIYKATETVSFAQGDLMMLGAFGAFAGMSLFGLPFWLAAILAVVAMAAFGVLLELVVIRPILGQPQFSIVMLTIGIAYVARGLITMVPGIGTETHTLPVPYKDQIWKLGGWWSTSSSWRSSSPRPSCAPCCSRCSATASWASRCRPRRRTSSRPTTWAFR
jgi:branched-chain amino acid transport system permease protein